MALAAHILPTYADTLAPGSASRPGMSLPADRSTGFFDAGPGYDSGAGVRGRLLGVAQFGRRVGGWGSRIGAAGEYNSILVIGEEQTLPSSGSAAFTGTIQGASAVLPAGYNTPWTPINIGAGALTAMGTSTTAQINAGELDKLTVAAGHASGLLTASGVNGGWVCRTVSPGAGVTMPLLRGLRISPPADGGTVTRMYAFSLETGLVAAVGTMHGIVGEEDMPGGHLASTDGTPLRVKASATGTTSAGELILEAANSNGIVKLRANGNDVAWFKAGGTNRLEFYNGSTPTVQGVGGSLNVSGGSGQGISFLSNATAVEGMRLNHTASGANRLQVTPGTTGNGVTLSTAGDSNSHMILDPAGTGTVVILGLPTSSAGLPTGGLWNDTGTLKVA